MTAEQRRQVIDFGKGYGAGMPIPSGMIGATQRTHIVNGYFEAVVVPPSPFFFWRNRNLVVTNWTERIPPPDSSTQVI